MELKQFCYTYYGNEGRGRLGPEINCVVSTAAVITSSVLYCTVLYCNVLYCARHPQQPGRVTNNKAMIDRMLIC